jgi:hypothetical protein
MQITTDPAKINAALKAVRAFVSDDATRSALCNVYVEALSASKLRFTATDGHTLCSITIDGADVGGTPARLTPIAVDTVLLQAKGAKGLTAFTFTFDDCSDQGQFPEVSKVIPEKAPVTSSAPAVFGFNGMYLSRLGPVQKAIKAQQCRIQMSADEGPMRADLAGDLGDALVVLMPMRLAAEAA